MPESSQRLQAVLDGYAEFLRDKHLAFPRHQPHLVRWVREFLQFATDHAGYTFEQTLDLYLAEVGRRVREGVGRQPTRTDRHLHQHIIGGIISISSPAPPLCG